MMGADPRKLLRVAGILCMIGAARMAHPCSCLPSPPPLEALETSAAVFVGRVMEIRYVDESRYDVLFEVERSWKGVDGSRILVWTPPNEAACGILFEWGEQYIVYAGESEGSLSAFLCSRTAPLRFAENDLMALGEGRPVASPASIDGDLTGDGKADLSDAVRSLRIAVGLESPLPSNDLSGDGRQTLADTMLLLRHTVKLLPRFPIGRTDPYCGEWRATQTIQDATVFSPGPLVLEGKCTFPTAGYEVKLIPAAERGLNDMILALERVVRPPTAPRAEARTEVPVRYEKDAPHGVLSVHLLPDNLAVLVKPMF